MDTLEFFRAVLPPSGVYYAAVPVPYNNSIAWKHRPCSTLEELAWAVNTVDSQGGTVYFACAAYKQPFVLNESGRKSYRKADNHRAAKAFWVDIDCSAEKAAKKEGYVTQMEGATTLLKWCHEHHLHKPMIINSGYGVHAYWCLTKEVENTEWYRVSSMIKGAMKRDGILADPTRTADMSSVLRPVGTHNRKRDTAKEVKLSLAAELIDTGAFIQAVEALGVAPEGVMAVPDFMKDNTEKIAIPFIEVATSAKLAADKCKQLAIMRDTQGDVCYEHWRGVIGIIAMSTEDDISLAEEWSARRAETGHQQTDVETKYRTWDSPPTTCEFFDRCNPGVCDDCPFKGKVNTPLTLGREMPKTESEVVEGQIEGEPSAVSQVEVPELPPGYQWTGDTLVRFLPNKDGVLEPHSLSRVRFYIYQRIRDENGCMVFQARAHLPRNVIREFTIPGNLVGVGGSKLLELLGQYEVLATNNKDSGMHMHAFIKDSVLKLSEIQDARQTYSHFGWQKDGSFLLGNRLYSTDGCVTEALLSDNAQQQASAFPRPKGSLKAYSEKLNWVYNRDGMQPMQYLICSMWAAPLAEFCDTTYNGIPCAVTGADSGKGKTSAAYAALYAFGNALPDLTISGKRGSTMNAQATFLGVLHNLPVLFDEVTNKDARQLSELCYALSNGVESMRLKSTGGRVGFGDRETWRTHTAMTGNSHIGARLATQGNSEAESMRVFEIRVDSYDIPKLDPLAVSTAVTGMSRNVGCAGDVYVKYLVCNREKVCNMIIDELQNLHVNDELVSKPKYRFYRNHIACTLVAARIMHELGVVEFDLDKLKAFAMKAVNSLFREELSLSAMTYEEMLAKMIEDLGPKIITTLTYDIAPNSEPYRVNAPQGVIGRRIKGSANIKDEPYDGKLYISSGAISEWCVNNRIDTNALATGLKNSGVLLDRRARVVLGKSTTVTTAQTRCWAFDVEKLETMNGD